MHGLRESSLPELAPQEQRLWSGLVEERCGLYFGDSRSHYLRRCLLERMRCLRVSGFAEYMRMVTGRPGGTDEWGALQEVLVNRETSFFRHRPSFEMLANKVLPTLMRLREKGNSSEISLWSAGCATGAEAYSMAMTALAVARPAGWEIRVQGSDLSRHGLDQAREGRYTERVVAQLPSNFRRLYLQPQVAAGGAQYSVSDQVRQCVEFVQRNLTEPESYGSRTFDVIFCQNVLIYFRASLRKQVVRWLAGRLRDKGFLFLAPGEIVGTRFEELTLVPHKEVLVYRRSG